MHIIATTYSVENGHSFKGGANTVGFAGEHLGSLLQRVNHLKIGIE